MTRSVDECRSEWKRLNVPDGIANEMAAELEADLRDAETDGLSPEDVLGDGVFDPRSFAAAWASERGVIPATTAPPARTRRPLVATVIAVVAIAALLAGIAVLTGRRTTHVSIAAAPWSVRPAIVLHRLPKHGKHTRRFFITPARGRTLFPVRTVPVGLVRSGIDLQPVGWILVVLGVGGIAASIVVSQRFPLRIR